MNTMNIMLHNANQIKDFVNIASKTGYDVILSQHNIDIDGTSIIGVSSLDLSERITLKSAGSVECFRRFEV